MADEALNGSELKALVDLKICLRQLAANLLRVMAGGGKPYEIVGGIAEACHAVAEFQKMHGHWPSSQLLASIINPRETLYELRPWISENESDEHRYEREVEYRVYDGAMRAAASTLVNQLTQMAAAERAMNEAIRERNDLYRSKRFGHG